MGATARGMMTNFEVQTLAGRQPHDHAGQSNCRRPPRPPLRRATFSSVHPVQTSTFSDASIPVQGTLKPVSTTHVRSARAFSKSATFSAAAMPLAKAPFTDGTFI